MTRSALENIAIVLVGTKYPGNLGAVARAMNNMGISDLRLVRPQCAADEESTRMARSGADLLEKARKYSSLRAALRGVRVAVGTTGKTGGHRAEVTSPRKLAPRLLAQAVKQRIALVFGPEDTGLVDQDLELCQLLTRIPTHPRARSINLAQSVMILCYELRQSRPDRVESKTRLAPVEQVEPMYDHLRSALLKIGFLHPQNTSHMMFTLRRLFGRTGLTEADVALLRGLARQIEWYSKR